MRDFVLRGRSNSASGPTPSVHSTKTAPRMSILTSVKLPSLRRQDPNEPPPNAKTPLLTLKFSSRSFLDSQLHEENTGELLYHFKTVGTSTIISRHDPKELFVRMASVKWPRSLPTKTGKDYTDGVLIQMKNARWYGGETLLKLGSNANSSRRFSIPNFNHPLKWKRYGNVYWCTTTSVKGPIATLDASKGPDPLKLTVYETFHDKYDTEPLPGFRGVSVLLLDYLLITSMLFVTDLQEWMLVRNSDGQSLAGESNGQGPSFAPEVPFRSDPKFRKIMYGEPLFRKTSGEGPAPRTSGARRSSSRSPSSSQRRPFTPPITPDSGMPTFLYPDSDGLSSPDPPSEGRFISQLSMDTDSEDDDDFSLVETRSTSAIADSYHFSSAGPSNYTDTTFSSMDDLPPVPPLPIQYGKSLRDYRSQPSTPVSGTFSLSLAGSSRDSRQFSDGGSHHPRMQSFARSESVMSHASNMTNASMSAASSSARPGTRRPLPRPPPVPPLVESSSRTTERSPSPAGAARRVQSSSQVANYPPFSNSSSVATGSSPLSTAGTATAGPSRPQRSLPATPGIIASPTSTSNPMQTALLLGPNVDTNTSIDAPYLDYDNLTVEGLHSRRPPITKVSQEDLATYVHTLTSPDRDLPPQPIPSSSIFDVPPPSYNSINFERDRAQPPNEADYETRIDDEISSMMTGTMRLGPGQGMYAGPVQHLTHLRSQSTVQHSQSQEGLRLQYHEQRRPSLPLL